MTLDDRGVGLCRRFIKTSQLLKSITLDEAGRTLSPFKLFTADAPLYTPFILGERLYRKCLKQSTVIM